MHIALRFATTTICLAAALTSLPALAGGGVGWSLSIGGGSPYYPPPAYYPPPPYNNYSNYYSPPIIYGSSVEIYEAPPSVIIYGRPSPSYWRGPPPGYRPHDRNPGYRHDHRGYRDGHRQHDHRR